jgi:Flp pilus assembly protein CpaB
MRLNRTAQVGLIVILFALGLLVFYSLQRKEEPPRKANNTGNTVNVSDPVESGLGFKARFAIPPRAILTMDMFEPTRLESNETDQVFVTSLRTQGVGFITAKQIEKGAKLRHEDLLGHISYLGVSAAIQDPSLRAFSIPVTNKATLHDIVSVGDFVDVIATFDQAETRILAPGVRVLAVDIYGANYEKASTAKRGAFRGDDRPGGPPPPPDAQNRPANANGEPAPTPAPASGTPQPARPEASITLEMRPDQASAIALAQASNAPLDFLIQPRPTTLSLPVITEARVTKPMVAPYAVASKRSGGSSAPARTPVRVASTDGGGGNIRRVNNRQIPDFGPVGGLGNMSGLPPAGFATPIPPKKTYEITIYPDGQPARTNTVPLPE